MQILATLATFDIVYGIQVYVYRNNYTEALTQDGSICTGHVFGAEVILHEHFASTQTEDPHKADIFFVPMYVGCIYYGSANATSMEMDEPLLEELSKYQKAIIDNEHFKRNNGSDHVFVLFFKAFFPHWRSLIPNSRVLTVESEAEFEISSRYFQPQFRIHGSAPPFNPVTDIIIPPFIKPMQLRLIDSFSLPCGQSRKWFVSFFGKRWADVDECHPIRQGLADLFGNRADSFVRVVDSVKSYAPLSTVASVMGDSSFCLIPRGRSAFTTRFFDALWAGCIPVILSDHMVLPFESEMDPGSYSVKWPTRAMDETLISYLQSISPDRINSMRTAGARVRCAFVYADASLCPNDNAISHIVRSLTQH